MPVINSAMLTAGEWGLFQHVDRSIIWKVGEIESFVCTENSVPYSVNTLVCTPYSVLRSRVGIPAIVELEVGSGVLSVIDEYNIPTLGFYFVLLFPPVPYGYIHMNTTDYTSVLMGVHCGVASLRLVVTLPPYIAISRIGAICLVLWTSAS